MAIRPILPYPHSGLAQTCQPVTVFDERVKTLCADLLDTMRAAPGVGITAAHIGVFERVFVLELSPQDGVRNYINPELISVSEKTLRHTEGSVSMPGYTDEVERPSSIRLRYQDVDGVFHEEDAEGFHAICIQHEIDQLDGMFWLQRLSRLKRDRLVRKWQKAAHAPKA
ncbi:peptide deformylase [Agrobacterium sp.]|uniref:peptide deformylase n=1 Tax=Agrobacterium sp. TaxID=361 RepID=UPI0028A7F7CE|nr:peptide deformylase [Agrobacterium sp.]